MCVASNIWDYCNKIMLFIFTILYFSSLSTFSSEKEMNSCIFSANGHFILFALRDFTNIIQLCVHRKAEQNKQQDKPIEEVYLERLQEEPAIYNGFVEIDMNESILL